MVLGATIVFSMIRYFYATQFTIVRRRVVMLADMNSNIESLSPVHIEEIIKD